MNQPIIFVHGGFQGGWVWEPLLPLLDKKFTPYCITLKGLGSRAKELAKGVGLEQHIQDVVDVIQHKQLSDVILVGHSYGGMVISGAATRLPERIKHMIYLDAVVPEDGESLQTILGAEYGKWIVDAAGQGEGWRINPFPPEGFGLQADDQWAASQLTPQSIKTFTDPIHVKLPKQAQYTFIRCLRSHPVMSQFAARAQAKGWHFKEIDTPHCPMITHPELLSQLFNALGK